MWNSYGWQMNRALLACMCVIVLHQNNWSVFLWHICRIRTAELTCVLGISFFVAISGVFIIIRMNWMLSVENPVRNSVVCRPRSNVCWVNTLCCDSCCWSIQHIIAKTPNWLFCCVTEWAGIWRVKTSHHLFPKLVFFSVEDLYGTRPNFIILFIYLFAHKTLHKM